MSHVFILTVLFVQQGGARVVAYDHMLGMLVASKPSSNQLFPGYGLVKVGGILYIYIHATQHNNLKLLRYTLNSISEFIAFCGAVLMPLLGIVPRWLHHLSNMYRVLLT